MANKLNNNSHPICSQCGSELIFISQETIQPEGTRYPQTTTIYKCSNEVCQKKKDKEKADRQKLRLSQAVTQKERMEKMEKRKRGREAKLQEN